jgi:CMP-2-keto-3-deoxyoctulosonic acid synthetase
VETTHHAISVDTHEDVMRVRQWLAKLENRGCQSND